MDESLSSHGPDDPIARQRAQMDELATALVLWNKGDRTAPEVEQAGTTAIGIADELIRDLDTIRLGVELEQRHRRDAQYAMEIDQRLAATLHELQNGKPPHTVDSDEALVGAYTDENTRQATTVTGPYEAELPRNDYHEQHCISRQRCMGWCLLDEHGRNCDQINADRIGGDPAERVLHGPYADGGYP